MLLTDTAIPAAPPDAYDLADLLTGLADLMAFYKTNPGAPKPGGEDGVCLPVRVPGQARGERLANLEIIAEQMGAQVERRDGSHIAVRRFGPFTLQARVRDEKVPHEDPAAVTEDRKARGEMDSAIEAVRSWSMESVPFGRTA